MNSIMVEVQTINTADLSHIELVVSVKSNEQALSVNTQGGGNDSVEHTDTDIKRAPALKQGQVFNLLGVSCEKQFDPIQMMVEELQLDSLTQAVRIVLKPTDRAAAKALCAIDVKASSALELQPIMSSANRAHRYPKIPAQGIYTEEARQQRLAFVKAHTDAVLEQVEQTQLNPKSLVGNIEGFIGSVELPVGIAGPLKVNGQHANGVFYAPLATTEGALLASITRGATALSESGGVNVRVDCQRMFRVPLFKLRDMNSAYALAAWIDVNQKKIKSVAEHYSNYAQLIAITCKVFGNTVSAQFEYETADAAGQNMTTTCTWEACQWIIKNAQTTEGFELEKFLIEANLSSDKKVSYNSLINTRGSRVQAEAFIPAEVAQRVLKVSPSKFIAAYYEFVKSSVATGMIGFNVNVANTIAAMFAATGQDIACVHESSIGQFHMELLEDNSLYATMHLPSMIVGTVGGGTNIAQQRECLDILGCSGPGNSRKLAEIIAGYCLALDLSTLAAIASDQFARAHEKLGRNRPIVWLTLNDFDISYFNRLVTNAVEHRPPIQEVSLGLLSDKGSSIITELTAHKVNKLVGHFPFSLHFNTPNTQPLKLIVKAKPLDDEVILMINSLACMGSSGLSTEFNRWKDQVGFKHCHTRELAVMSETDPRFTSIAPIIYDVWEDPSREIYVIVQEDISDFLLINSINDTTAWTPDHINRALEDIAVYHSLWYENEEALLDTSWIGDVPCRKSMTEKSSLWNELGAHAHEEFPQWYTEQDLSNLLSFVENIGDWYQELDEMAKTLVHNDFNPRNLAFRPTPLGLKLCAYDWELATIQVPQHDLAELLVFTLNPAVIDPVAVDTYIETHRQALAKATGQIINSSQWRRGYELSLRDLAINRMPMYIMAHTHRHYEFLERVHTTLRNLLTLELNRNAA